ncbi:olfactory receptor 10-like [Tachyglossus aculeatus]|uniref:olfactory receptor 10-like n=1 Tax=Tachyglossus aculeatus TaxID=9261 RepID=UPI0018F5F255|nr:olfactory receptor 10-like [Tachyglossus aculeatus]
MMPSGEDFVLVSFSAQPQLEKILFVVVLIYLQTLMGNTAIILVTHLDLRLHTPMYYFLSYLSLEDHCFTTGIVPYLCGTSAGSPRPSPWSVATIVFCLPRCGHQRLPHFTYEMPALLKLAYVDVRDNEIQLFVGTLGSIARTVLKIKSPQVWRKALGTCGSHLLLVTLFYGSIMVVYIWPNSSFSGPLYKFLTLFLSVVIPTFNHLIYTLRNKDVKGAVRRILGKDQSSEKG